MSKQPMSKILLCAIIAALIIGFLAWGDDSTSSKDDCMKYESSAYVKKICSESKAN
jgi:hypothetical protein